MAIEKINFSYPRGSLQSVFEGDAITALELSALNSAKVDECVELVNGVEQSAIDATAIVDNMLLAQEQFLTDNADTRATLIAENQTFIDELTASKTQFETDLNTEIETIVENAESTIQTNVNTKIDALITDGTIENLINDVIIGDVNIQVANVEKSIEESTGMGVITGLQVLAQSNPNMSILISSGIAHIYNGKRYTLLENSTHIIDAPDALYDRIDIIYINSNGVLMYGKGQAQTTPIAPTTINGVLLAEIYVAKTAVYITSSNITDKRQIKLSLTELKDKVLKKINEVANVIEFGAHSIDEDGFENFDSTEAFQSAIDSLPLSTSTQGVQSPKGFVNGGQIFIPRGRYKISSPIILQRGIQIIGISREASQIISFSPSGVFKYTDIGTYLQDEIVVKNISIWQDATIIATAGAGIEIASDGVTMESNYFNIDNVLIEGTYYGIKAMGGVGCAIRNSNISKCIKSGVVLTLERATTSTIIESTYSHINGEHGFEIKEGVIGGKVGVYTSFVSTGSDSNKGYGYKITDCANVSFISCGCEWNDLAGFYMEDCASIFLNGYALSNKTNGIDIKLCKNVNIINSWLNGTVGNGINVITPLGQITIIGTTFEGLYATNKINSIYKVLNLSDDNGLVGSKNNWAIGVTQQPDADSVFNVGGNADTDSTTGVKTNVFFTGAGASRNSALYTQANTADSIVTYPQLVTHFIANAFKGAQSLITKCVGIFLNEHTRGTTSNVNLLISTSGAVADGQFSIYNESSRDNMFNGDLSFGVVNKGVIVRTPDGSKRYRIGVDNTGAIVTTLL